MHFFCIHFFAAWIYSCFYQGTIFSPNNFYTKDIFFLTKYFLVYGKARYSQIRRYSQIQNVLARVFKHPGERGFLYLLRRGGKSLS